MLTTVALKKETGKDLSLSDLNKALFVMVYLAFVTVHNKSKTLSYISEQISNTLAGFEPQFS